MILSNGSISLGFTSVTECVVVACNVCVSVTYFGSSGYKVRPT